jgi:hypothetical protein
MNAIADLPFFPIHFDASGAPEHQTEIDALLAHIAANSPARLVVVSHGWRNDETYAQQLYNDLFGNVAARLKTLGSAPKDLPTIAGVFWPSMALPEFDDSSATNQNKQDGAAAALDAPELDQKVVEDQIDALISNGFGNGDLLISAKALLGTLEDSPANCKKFVELLRQTAPPTTDASEDNSDRFLNDDAADIFDRLLPPIDVTPVDNDAGGALGLADAVSNVTETLLNTATGALGSAFRLVNYLTFYQMKERAGVIGQGLNKVLGKVRENHATLPIILVGHSFGARVVTSAAARGANLDPCSLILLQGAFSHNGFASKTVWEKDGYFRAAFQEKRVSGPLIATYTANDQAVGTAYPIACRIAGQNANALGDANDPFGGIGRNGAIHLLTEEKGTAVKLLGETGVYVFDNAKANNLLADDFIHSHGDVTNPAVANVVAQVIKLP